MSASGSFFRFPQATDGPREQFEEFDDLLRGLRVAVAGLLGDIVLEGSTPVGARRDAARGMARAAAVRDAVLLPRAMRSALHCIAPVRCSTAYAVSGGSSWLPSARLHAHFAFARESSYACFFSLFSF